MPERKDPPAGPIERLRALAELERQIREAQIKFRILFDAQTSGVQTTAGLPEVFQLSRQIKKSDKLSVSDLRSPSNQIDALVIPDTSLHRLPQGINQVPSGGRIITGIVVALFKQDTGQDTGSVEYRLYDRLSETEMGIGIQRYTVYTPIRLPLQSHGEIYSRQSPAVRLGLLLATVRAIYERANPQIFSKP